MSFSMSTVRGTEVKLPENPTTVDAASFMKTLEDKENLKFARAVEVFVEGDSVDPEERKKFHDYAYSVGS